MAIGGTELRYDLSGDGLQITYSQYRGERPDDTTYISQELHYHTKGSDYTFSGDDIRSQTSELGTLLTVTIPISTSSEETKFTLLIPTDEQQLGPEATIQINALAIQTESQGQLLNYQAYSLQGTVHLDLFP